MMLFRRPMAAMAALAAALPATPAAVAHPHHDVVEAVSHSHGVEWIAGGLLVLAVLVLVRHRLRHRAARHDGA